METRPVPTAMTDGSALFSYLWFKSPNIPRLLAAGGIFASSITVIAAVLILIEPAILSVLTLAYRAPMGIYELALGFWLLFKGIRLPAN